MLLGQLPSYAVGALPYTSALILTKVLRMLDGLVQPDDEVESLSSRNHSRSYNGLRW